jgi:dienelactone hydrolase
VIPPVPLPVPRIVVRPDAPALDTPLDIRLEHFPPGAEVTVRAGTRDLLGRRWASRAVFLADELGEVDIATQAPLAGSYRKADPMGLIWSMAEDLSGGIVEPPRDDPLPPQALTIAAEVEGIAGIDMVIDRLRQPLGVERALVRSRGLVGTLFTPAGGRPHPGVILLGGGEGGLHEIDGALLAAHGFAVLSLAYFGMEGLRRVLVDVPLEYFATAVSFMEDNELVRSDRLAIMGSSRGGEAALLVASVDARLRAAVSVVGSGVMTQGIPPADTLLEMIANHVSAWTQDGRPLAFLPSNVPPDLADQIGDLAPVELTLSYRDGLADADAVAAASIPVERINGPVLLLSAGQDKTWPSQALTEVAAERLRKAGRPFEHVIYEGAGHSIAPPPYGPATELTTPGPERRSTTGPELRMAHGGTPEANAQAREDGWLRVRRFLREHLGD